MTSKQSINTNALRAELVRRGSSMAKLAGELGVPVTTLSGWVHDRHPGPADLLKRIADVLGVKASALTGGGSS
jgi:transcriptional regulator with XRE-family HTH domain